MATRIVLKNSSMAGRKPRPEDLATGEICLNLADKKLYSKNADDEIIEISSTIQSGDTPGTGVSVGDLFWDGDNLLAWNGTQWVPVGGVISVNGLDGDVTLALNDLDDVLVDGVTNSQVLAYQDGSWRAVSTSSLSVNVDLGYTPAGDRGTITNSAGDNAEIPLGNGTNAGLSLNNFSATDKSTLDSALQSVALGYTAASDKGTITNNAGSNATIPRANGTNAGLSLNNYTTAEKNKLASYPNDPADTPVPTPNLQAVTNAGSTTTTGASFGGKVTSASTGAGDSGTTLVTKDFLTSSLPTVGNGQINVSGGTGITASGNNATANQSGNTNRTLSVDTDWLGTWLGNNYPLPSVGNGQINVNGNSGITASGDNARANQSGNTTRTLSVNTSWLENNWSDARYVNKGGDTMSGNLTFGSSAIVLNTNGNLTMSGTFRAGRYDLSNLTELT